MMDYIVEWVYDFAFHKETGRSLIEATSVENARIKFLQTRPRILNLNEKGFLITNIKEL